MSEDLLSRREFLKEAGRRVGGFVLLLNGLGPPRPSIKDSLPVPPKGIREEYISKGELEAEEDRIVVNEGLSQEAMNMTAPEFSSFIEARSRFNLMENKGMKNAGGVFNDLLAVRRECEKDPLKLRNYERRIHQLKKQVEFKYVGSEDQVDPSTQYIFLARLIEDFGILDGEDVRVPAMEKCIPEGTVITINFDLKQRTGSSTGINSATFSNMYVWQLSTGKQENKREDVAAHEMTHNFDQKRPLGPDDNTVAKIWDSYLPFSEVDKGIYDQARETLLKYVFPFPTEGGTMYAYSPSEFISSTVGVFVADRDYFLNPDFNHNLGFSIDYIFQPEEQIEIKMALKSLAEIYTRFFYEKPKVFHTNSTPALISQ